MATWKVKTDISLTNEDADSFLYGITAIQLNAGVALGFGNNDGEYTETIDVPITGVSNNELQFFGGEVGVTGDIELNDGSVVVGTRSLENPDYDSTADNGSSSSKVTMNNNVIKVGSGYVWVGSAWDGNYENERSATKEEARFQLHLNNATVEDGDGSGAFNVRATGYATVTNGSYVDIAEVVVRGDMDVENSTLKFTAGSVCAPAAGTRAATLSLKNATMEILGSLLVGKMDGDQLRGALLTLENSSVSGKLDVYGQVELSGINTLNVEIDGHATSASGSLGNKSIFKITGGKISGSVKALSGITKLLLVDEVQVDAAISGEGKIGLYIGAETGAAVTLSNGGTFRNIWIGSLDTTANSTISKLIVSGKDVYTNGTLNVRADAEMEISNGARVSANGGVVIRGDVTVNENSTLSNVDTVYYDDDFASEYNNPELKVTGGTVKFSSSGTNSIGKSGNAARKGTLTLESGAVATGGKLVVAEGGVANVNASKLDIDKVTINEGGKVFVRGTSELHIDTLTGTVDIDDGATVKNSYIGGAVAVDGGEVAFDGANTVASIDAKNGATVNINAGDSLDVTGSRTKLYNETINITGEIADALTADKSALNASLKMKGMSLAGNALENDTTVATLNVTNAYVDLSAGDLSSKPDANGSSVANADAASGTYNLNFTNSILDVKKVSIENQSKAKFDIDIDGSVVNASSNFVMADKDSEMTLSNGSVVNINSSFKSDGTINILSGSKLIANNVIQPSENAGMYGTVNVDNAELELLSSGNVIGHAVVNEGNINLTNSAKAKVNFINNSGTVNVTGSTFTATGAVTNSGTVNVTGADAFVNANSISGNGKFVMTGVTLDDRWNISGTQNEWQFLGDNTISKEVDLNGNVYFGTLIAGEPIADADKALVEASVNTVSADAAFDMARVGASMYGVVDGKYAELNINNNAVANIGYMQIRESGKVNITDGATVISNASSTNLKGILNIDGGTYTSVGGSVAKSAVITISNYGQWIDDPGNGSMDFAAGAEIQLSNNAFFSTTSWYGSAEITMDYTSKIVVNVPAQTNIAITVDTTGYTGGTYLIADFNKAGQFNTTSANTLVFNNDLYVTDQDADTVYVNSAYTGSVGDITADGKIIGYNAFAAATGAFGSGAAEIIVESDINELLATDYDFVIGQDTKISSSVDGEARLVNFYNNGTSYDIVIGGDHSNSVRETLTIGENVTLEVADRIIWAGYYGNDVDVVVDGTLSGTQLWIGADTTVSATGKLVSAGEAFVLRRGATVTLNGDAAQGVTDGRTALLDVNYTSLLAGTIEANNTLITSGKIGANNAGYSGEGSIHVKLDNTIWNSTGNLQLGSGVLFEVNNGSILNVTLHDGYEASSIGTTSSLWVDGGTVNASTMNVSGEIDVYNGKLNIASGKALTINEGGKVFVRGVSDVKAAVDGAGWLYIEDAELDSDTVITGKTANVRVVSGSSTVSGSELDVNAFQVGVGKGEDDLLDTLTGSTITFKDNAKLSVGGDTYDGWVGSQYAKRNEITDARYVLNVENSMMKAGYLHISTDGILNVSGHISDDNKYVDNGRKVDFYAGDFIINGVANFSGTDAFIRYLKVSVDNTGTAAPGTVNITDGANVLAMITDGANDSQTSFIIYNNGIVNVDNATFTVDDKTNIAAGGKLNAANGANVTLEGTATNNGTINITGSTFTANSVDNSGTFNVENGVLNGGTVSNSGTIDVKGKSKLLIDAMTGTIVAASGATVYDSSITGTGDYASVEKADGYKYVLAADGVLNFEGTNYIHSVEAGAGDTVNVTDEIAFGADGFKLGDGAVWNIENATVNSSYGLSLDGADMTDDGNDPVSTMNVKNSTFNMAQISAKDGYKDNEAYRIGYGTFNVNFEGSTVNLSNRLQIQAQETANVNINFTGDSEVSALHFINYSSKGTVTFDESKAAFTQNFGNAGTVNILNGATVNATYGTSGLGMSGEKPNGNSGTINVTGSTFALTGSGAFTNSGTISITNGIFTANSVTNTGAFDINGGTVAIGTLNNNGSGRTKIAGETFITVDVLGGDNSMWLMDDAVLLEGSGIFSGVTVRAVGSKVTFGKADNGSDGTITVAEFDNRFGYAYDTSGSQAGQELVINDTLVVSEDWFSIFGASDGDSTVVNGNGKIVANNSDAILQNGKIELNVDVETGRHLRFSNTDITITGTVSATVPDSVVAGQLTALKSANVTVDGGTIDTAHNLLIGYDTYIEHVGVVDTYKSTLTLKNGGVVETDYDLYLNKASEIVANNGTLTVGGNAYTYAESEIALTNSTFTVTGAVTNSGTVSLTGSTFTADSVTNNGGINMSWDSCITVGQLSGSAYIYVDATGWDGTVRKVVDVTGGVTNYKVRAQNLTDGKLIQHEKDYYLVKVDNSIIYVDSKYNSFEAAAADGLVLNYNAFNSVSAGIDGQWSNTQKVVIRNDFTESVSCIEGNITTDVDGGVVINSTYTDYIEVSDATIGENVTFKNGAYYFCYGTVNINGAIEASDVLYNGYGTTVNVNGKLTTTETSIIRYNSNAEAGMYVVGTAAAGKAAEAEVSYKSGYYTGFYSGTLKIKDAKAEAGYFLLQNSYDSGYAPANLVLDNAHLSTVGTGDGQKQFIADGNASITMSNKSALDVLSYMNVNSATVEINVADSTLKVGETLTNAGKINLNDNSVLTAGSIANSGSITLTGNAALNGDIELNGTAARLNFGTETVKYTGGTFSSDIDLSNGSFATGHPESGQLQIVNGDVTMTGNIDGDANSTLSIGGSILNNDSTAAATLTLKGNTVTVGTFWVGAADKVMEAASMKDGRFALIVDGAVLNAIQYGGGNASPRNTGSITVKNGGKVTTSNSQNAIRGNVLVTGEGSQFNSRNTNIYSEDNAAAATMEYTDKATGTFIQGLTVGKADNATRTGLLKVNNSASVEISTGNLTVNASGAVSITDNAALTVTAGSVTNKGKISVEGATFTANSVENSGTFNVTGTSTINAELASGNIVVDTATLKGNIENNGFIYFVNDNTLAAEITGTGKVYIGQNGTASDLYAKVSVADDVAVSNGYFMVDDNALLAIASGKKFTFTGDSSNTDCYRFVFAGGNLDLDGELNIENSATRFSRANVNVADTAVVNAEQHICIYNSDVTINGEFNVTGVSGRGEGIIIGHNSYDYAIGTASVKVSGSSAKLSVADCGTTVALRVYSHANGSGSLTVEDGAEVNIGGIVDNSGTITVDNANFSARKIVNSGDIYLTNAVFKANVTGAGNFIVSGNVAIDSTYSVENGSLTVNQDSALTVAGSAEFATVENNGTITVDWTASFGFANIVNNGTFTIDLTGYKGDAEGKVVLDHATGWTAEQYKALLGSSWDDAYFSVNADGDLVLNGGVVTTVYVNGDYSENGTNDGHTWGVDAFNNHADALAKNPQNIIVTGGAFTTSSGHNGSTAVIKDGSFKNVYAGGSDGSVLSDSTDMTIEKGSFMNVYGGSLVKAPLTINQTSVTQLAIKDGSFGYDVIGGDYVRDGIVIRESSNLTISGGTFSGYVAGGMKLNTQASSVIASARVGDVNFTITGGTFTKRVYGGNFASNYAMSHDTAVTGNINLVIDATQNDITFGEHIVGGSYAYGKVEGDVRVTFSKAADKTISFAADSIVLGGSDNGYTVIGSDGTRTPYSFVTGERVVIFDNYSGDFGAAIKMFSDIDVTGNSNVNFTSSFSFADISDWDIEFGSSLSGIAANDFTGDEIDLDLTGFDGNDWTVMVGTESALNTFGAAGSVTLGDEIASWDGSRWVSASYELTMEDDGENKKLVFGTLA